MIIFVTVSSNTRRAGIIDPSDDDFLSWFTILNTFVVKSYLSGEWTQCSSRCQIMVYNFLVSSLSIARGKKIRPHQITQNPPSSRDWRGCAQCESTRLYFVALAASVRRRCSGSLPVKSAIPNRLTKFESWKIGPRIDSITVEIFTKKVRLIDGDASNSQVVFCLRYFSKQFCISFWTISKRENPPAQTPQCVWTEWDKEPPRNYM